MLPKPFAFVLMPFGDDFRDTYLLGIKPACEEAGYYCERLDEQIFEETMLQRIYNQIAKADLIVADLSQRNPNVFYETGYAHALGKTVILLTRNSEDIPFDLKHYFHIVYSTGITELKQRLKERAAYYISHPSASTLDPFDQFSILINGKIVDRTQALVSVDAKLAHFSALGFVVRIDIALHLSEDSIDSEIGINLRLITSPQFPRSGWRVSGQEVDTYTTITMLDGRLMHRPLNPIHLSLGDPDKIAFDLLTGHDSSITDEEHSMTLRLISNGLQRDINLKVDVSS